VKTTAESQAKLFTDNSAVMGPPLRPPDSSPKGKDQFGTLEVGKAADFVVWGFDEFL
jgi:hypothetical protein